MVLKLPGTHRPTLRFSAFCIIKNIKLPGFDLKHFTFAGEDPYTAHGDHCAVTNFMSVTCLRSSSMKIISLVLISVPFKKGSKCTLLWIPYKAFHFEAKPCSN